MPLARLIHGSKDGRYSYADYLFDEAKREFNLFFKAYVQVKDKMIADIGCGEGGKIAFYAHLCSQGVAGLDICSLYAKRARNFCLKKGQAQKVCFVNGDVARLPFNSESFDIVFMNDTLEHLSSPKESLEEVKRILKGRGSLLITFSSWRSLHGSHLSDWIHVPWAHLLFSSKTLIKALHDISLSNPYLVYQFPQLIESSQLSTLTDFLPLNKMTLKNLVKSATSIGFEIRLIDFRPFPHFEKSLVSVLLRHLPLPMAEFVTRKVICVLQKLHETRSTAKEKNTLITMPVYSESKIINESP